MGNRDVSCVVSDAGDESFQSRQYTDLILGSQGSESPFLLPCPPVDTASCVVLNRVIIEDFRRTK